LRPCGFGGIAGAVVVALVEGQKPRALARELGAEAIFRVVHGEVRHTTPECEQRLAGVAVALVLRLGVGGGLFGEAVLELEGEDGQAVDEDYEIERALPLVAAVGKLAGHAEAIAREELDGRRVAR
jgi:hypothetical protein